MVNPFTNPFHVTYPSWVDNGTDFATVLSQSKPAYGPFPKMYLSSLPPSINPEDMKGCFCPTCASDLWNKLAPHPAKPDVVDENGNVTRTRVDVRQIVDMFISKVDRLLSGDLTAVEQKCLDGIFEYLDGLVEAYQTNKHVLEPHIMPQLQEFGEELNQLLFGGLLSNIEYLWAQPKSLDKDSLLEDTCYGVFVPGGDVSSGTHSASEKARIPHRILILAEIYSPKWGNGTVPRKLSEQPAALAQLLVSTMVHEMIHATFTQYACEGHCADATIEQGQLCSYLTTRTYIMYYFFEYKGRPLHHPTDNPITLCFHHGPAFTAVTRLLSKVMAKLLNLGDPVKLHIISPECEDECGTTCWGHCYDIEEEPQMLLQVLWDIYEKGPWPPSWIPWAGWPRTGFDW